MVGAPQARRRSGAFARVLAAPLLGFAVAGVPAWSAEPGPSPSERRAVVRDVRTGQATATLGTTLGGWGFGLGLGGLGLTLAADDEIYLGSFGVTGLITGSALFVTGSGMVTGGSCKSARALQQVKPEHEAGACVVSVASSGAALAGLGLFMVDGLGGDINSETFAGGLVGASMLMALITGQVQHGLNQAAAEEAGFYASARPARVQVAVVPTRSGIAVRGSF